MDITKIPQYELLEHHYVRELESEGYLMRHKKTGARVFVLENDDNNKVFNIAFRTVPTDSTGVAHIIEHTVLCGSDRYPVKDPFVELAKGSLNTFLNAMTRGAGLWKLSLISRHHSPFAQRHLCSLRWWS